MRPRPLLALPSITLPRFGALALTWSDGAALLAVLLWGVNFSITKQLMVAMDPLAVTFFRASSASLVFAAILIPTGRWLWPARRDIRAVVLTGLIGMSLNTVLWSYGLHLTTASHSGLIFTITPLMVFVVSHLLGALRLTRKDSVGLGLGILGAGIIVGAPLLGGTDTGGASLLGDLLTAGAALTWGVWMMLTAPLLRRYNTLCVTAWITIVGAAGLFFPALPGLLAHDWSSVTASHVGGMIYSGTISGVIGGLLWYGAVRRIGAARTIVYANMESFFVVICAALLLNERVEWTALLGGVAVIGGVLLTRRPTERNRPAQEH